MTSIHTSVLLAEVINELQPAPGKKIIDATLGAAGHTTALLAQGAEVLGIDQDQAIIDWVKQNLPNPHLTIVQANFMTIRNQAEKNAFIPCDGILFDLGVSSMQFDTPDRGFSFKFNAPLDMRMNQKQTTTATDIVNNMEESELFALLMQNAQEPKSRQIAHQIVTHRPITTTEELANLVLEVYQGKRGHLHPATRTFQALRIAVNQELSILKPALEDSFSLLKPNGKLCVISFHEGEDRIVKRTFEGLLNSGLACNSTKKPIIPTLEECHSNPRARSAKLRSITKS